MTIPQLWDAFCHTVHQVGSESLTPEAQQRLSTDLLLPTSAQVVVTDALQRFFCVPMHCNAVNTLNVQGFGGSPVVFPGGCTVDLAAIVTLFQGTGPSAQVWMALLDLAQACNPMGISTSAARSHLTQFLPAGAGAGAGVLTFPSTTPCAAPMGGGAGLESIIGGIVTALPRVHETLTKLLQGGQGGSPECLINHVQNGLLRPLLENLGNQEALEPAVNQILDGFRHLTQAMQQTEQNQAAPAPQNVASPSDAMAPDA